MSVAVVDCALEIRRSAEDVFDYVTDIGREFEWNPRTKRVVKLTDGPVGVGTCWEGEWIAGDPMLIDYVAFHRPRSWRSTGRSRGLLVASEGHVDPTPDGARLTLHVEFEPHSQLRLIARSSAGSCAGANARTLPRSKSDSSAGPKRREVARNDHDDADSATHPARPVRPVRESGARAEYRIRGAHGH